MKLPQMAPEQLATGAGKVVVVDTTTVAVVLSVEYSTITTVLWRRMTRES